MTTAAIHRYSPPHHWVRYDKEAILDRIRR